MKMPNEVITGEIKKKGAISLERFMEMALYCPETGYYEKKKDSVGREGDFITSVSVGALFGELLAFQLAEWLTELDADASTGRGLQLVEAGAHDGRLAADILGWLKAERPQLFAKLEYIILEPSPHRQEWQRETLKDFAPRVRWHGSDLSVLDSQIQGVIFSNELLDAFPIRQFGWEVSAKKWHEQGVTLVGGKLAWAKMTDPALPATLRVLPAALLEVLPEGYLLEASPAAEDWWRKAARSLKRGKLLAIDYGFTTEEMISPARTRGTLRAYFRHRVTDDVLANAGEQDLTAHVNFSAIQKSGEDTGLQTELFCPQPRFLTRILEQAIREKSFAHMDSRRIRQLQTLTHPEHLGRAFRVLVQTR